MSADVRRSLNSGHFRHLSVEGRAKVIGTAESGAPWIGNKEQASRGRAKAGKASTTSTTSTTSMRQFQNQKRSVDNAVDASGGPVVATDSRRGQGRGEGTCICSVRYGRQEDNI